MMRRSLFSDQPPASETPTESAPVSGVEQTGNDFGRWLTYDLRPKGAPSLAPPSEPSSEAADVQAQAALAPEKPAPEEPALASWLLRDLRPRSSAPPAVPPRTLAPPQSEALPVTGTALAEPRSVLPLASAASLALAAAPARGPDSLAPDSLVPHAVSEAPRARMSTSDLALDAEDLAVLPSSRARAAGQRRWRHAALLAALLGGVALLLWRGSGSSADAARRAASEPNLALAAAPLPPPPPQFVAEQDSEPAEPPPSAPASSHSAATPAAVEPPDDPSSPRGRRAGDAVARFADLPTPTLSKLAREERQKLRSRDASVRARKAASNSRP
jgi:hypothetical protein